ncbi:MAG: type IX secretion system protein PorQ [Prevotella sp.]|nr:type IX secretion system protein PorQ [Prevotella sp.]
MKKYLFSILLSIFFLSSQAQESQTAYNFLRLPVSAHGAALGGENITLIEDDPAMAFANPALLASVSDKTIGLNYMNYMSGANFGSVSFNKIIKKVTVGGAIEYIDYGKMKEVDANNTQTGEFAARDIAVQGMMSYELAKNFVGGINMKFITSYIGDYNSLAFGVDLGINYFDPEREWSLSAVAKNLGGQLKAYEEDFDKMPIDLQLGVSKRLLHTPFRLHATLGDLTHWNYKFIDHASAGVDVIFEQFWLGAGYNFRRAHEMRIYGEDDDESNHGAGITLGAGMSLERFKLNLSYAKYHVSSNSFMVSLAYSL